MIVPGGKPVTAVPGLRPKSPLITLGPVLVIVEPAKIAKLSAVPRSTVVAALISPTIPRVETTINKTPNKILLEIFIYSPSELFSIMKNFITFIPFI